ncbi:hypothetical protein HanPSC8_Chr06g0237861 [Helianthus annuus]|nr:hypothetical protein HanPSC8_Chr06g0237861 [Helianthus annuus]
MPKWRHWGWAFTSSRHIRYIYHWNLLSGTPKWSWVELHGVMRLVYWFYSLGL